ncbi:MAG: hypothetical protein N3G20_02420, partial [Verrucomicrobiae bacterium]|nr:hypothetical protein [Verrucomicrobiae bacterium]
AEVALAGYRLDSLGFPVRSPGNPIKLSKNKPPKPKEIRSNRNRRGHKTIVSGSERGVSGHHSARLPSFFGWESKADPPRK